MSVQINADNVILAVHLESYQNLIEWISKCENNVVIHMLNDINHKRLINIVGWEYRVLVNHQSYSLYGCIIPRPNDKVLDLKLKV